LLLDGQVKVVISSPSGRELILDVLDEGALFGELSAVDGEPRSATVIALNPITVRVIPNDQFREFLETYGVAATAVLALIVDRLRRTSRRQLEFGTNDALGRLCACLVSMVGRYGSAGASAPSVHMPLAQHEIASMTGLSREAVVKGLRTLRALEWIETRARDFTILDEAAMRTRAAT
jgi:CRP-like cAMP-binding protein